MTGKFFSQRVQNLHYKLDQCGNFQCPDIIGSILDCGLLLTLLILPMPGQKIFRDSFNFAFNFLDHFKITWEFSKQFSLKVIEAQESWRHRIWSVPQKNLKISRAQKHSIRWENRENLIENVLLVCSALKIIRWSKSASVAAEHPNSQVGKKFLSKKNKKVIRKN